MPFPLIDWCFPKTEVVITAVKEMDGKETRASQFLWHLLLWPYRVVQICCRLEVEEEFSSLELAFISVEQLSAERLKEWANISLIYANATAEEKNDVIKDVFYKLLEHIAPQFDKLILGDFTARVGKEGICDTTVGKFSIPNETSPNGLWLIDFAWAENMIVCTQPPA